jgi:hypothetical protein
MMCSVRPFGWVAAVSAAAILSACGGPTADARASAAPRAAASAPAAAAAESQGSRKQNACALVSREEIERIAGARITMLHDIEDADESTCELHDSASDRVFVYVKVLWKGGKEQARANQAGMSMAAQKLNTSDVDIAELTGSGKVRGLADKAFFSDILPSWFLKGDVLVEVISPLWPHDKTFATFKAVANSALPKL